MDFWVEADQKNGGSVHAMADDEVASTLTAKAEKAEANGQKKSAEGIRLTLAKTPDDARSYLAMMRVIGGAAKAINAERVKA